MTPPGVRDAAGVDAAGAGGVRGVAVGRHPGVGGAVAALLGGLLLAVGAVDRSAAATPGVELSSDGRVFASSLSSSVFDPSAVLVPRAGVDGAFWVRNGSGAPAFLRVALAGAWASEAAYADALTVTASTPGWPGSPVPLSAADPCHVLTQGQVIPAGGIVRIDTGVALGDLTGETAQLARAGFHLQVVLSSIGTGSIPANTCITASGTVPGLGTPGRAYSGGSGATPFLGGSGWSPVPSGGPTPSTWGWSGEPGPVIVEDGAAGAPIVGVPAAANTDRLHQERVVLLWLTGAVLGALAVIVVRRRRARVEQGVVAA